VLPEVLALDQRQCALVAVLLLRGPQTIGELRSRTERMTDFGGLDEVEHELQFLSKVESHWHRAWPETRTERGALDLSGRRHASRMLQQHVDPGEISGVSDAPTSSGNVVPSIDRAIDDRRIPETLADELRTELAELRSEMVNYVATYTHCERASAISFLG